MNKFKILSLLPFFLLSGCSTLYHLSADAERKFVEADLCPENCTIHRVYAGTAMDVCLIRGGSYTGQGGAIGFWDLPFSLVLDTVVLPYTMYKQLTVGGSYSVKIQEMPKCQNDT